MPTPLKINEYERFIAWIALPSAARQPSTQGELAKELGVEEATLSDWKKRDDFWPRVRETIGLWARGKTPDVVEGLYKRAAKTGDPGAAKLWMQAFDGFVEEQSINVSPQAKILEAYGVTKDGKLADDLVEDAQRIIDALEGEDGKDDAELPQAPETEA